ncbi:hypothetical protein [Plantactinospora sp. B5E13]|uniref:hypothetical protein n=1 Tax=unclassified Plantactinospora TaxID=2631981 RepID=UPI00325E3ABC
MDKRGEDATMAAVREVMSGGHDADRDAVPSAAGGGAGRVATGQPTATTAPTLLAIDFGSTWLRAWGLARGTASLLTADGPSAAPLVRRGRLVDLAAVTARLVREVYQQPEHRPAALAALARGMVLVGDGAARPELTVALAQALRIGVHPAAAPYTAALTGAGLAAMSAAGHPLPG